MAARPTSISADIKREPGSEPTFGSKLGSSSEVSLDSVPTSEDDFRANPFIDPKVAASYRVIYENAQYECRHVFDPDLRWTEKDENAIIRKVDWHVATWACIMFFALNLDRGNLKQAVSDNMLDQLGLSTNDYNYGRLKLPQLP